MSDKFKAVCYFQKLFSSGLDDAGEFDTEAAALKFGKKCVKDSKNPKAYATVGPKVITQYRGRLKISKWGVGGARKASGDSAKVSQYVTRYGQNRGLKPTFPRLVVGMMPEAQGWPVRNADGGANIGYFKTQSEAETAVKEAQKAFRSSFGKNWYET